MIFYFLYDASHGKLNATLSQVAGSIDSSKLSGRTNSAKSKRYAAVKGGRSPFILTLDSLWEPDHVAEGDRDFGPLPLRMAGPGRARRGYGGRTPILDRTEGVAKRSLRTIMRSREMNILYLQASLLIERLS
jgi:hypothetical protein